MYAYFGHHRCATQWTDAIVFAACRELDLRFDHSARYGEVPDHLDRVDFFAHINADMSIIEQLDSVDYRAFHVIRDPRDILVSSYFSDRYSHHVYSEEFAQFRSILNSVDFDEGLRLQLDRREREFQAIATWDYHNARVYETRFEVLTPRPYDEFARAFEFLNFPMPKTGSESFISLFRLVCKKVLRRLDIHVETAHLPHLWLRAILWRNSFRRRAGRRKGVEDQQHHLRKGVPGDWRNYLQGDNKSLFKERWGNLLIDLEYEEDLNW